MSEWWVNAEGTVRESDQDLYGEGYITLPDPKVMVEKGMTHTYAYCLAGDKSRYVPVVAERESGALRWRWRHAGGKPTLSQAEMMGVART